MNILSALTDWALEGSIVTADSMRARGYGAAKRSSFQIYRRTARDWALIGLMLLLATLVLLLGGTAAEFTPELAIAEPTWGLAAYAAYLLIPTALQISELAAFRRAIGRMG